MTFLTLTLLKMCANILEVPATVLLDPTMSNKSAMDLTDGDCSDLMRALLLTEGHDYNYLAAITSHNVLEEESTKGLYCATTTVSSNQACKTSCFLEVSDICLPFVEWVDCVSTYICKL